MKDKNKRLYFLIPFILYEDNKNTVRKKITSKYWAKTLGWTNVP